MAGFECVHLYLCELLGFRRLLQQRNFTSVTACHYQAVGSGKVLKNHSPNMAGCLLETHSTVTLWMQQQYKDATYLGINLLTNTSFSFLRKNTCALLRHMEQVVSNLQRVSTSWFNNITQFSTSYVGSFLPIKRICVTILDTASSRSYRCYNNSMCGMHRGSYECSK